MTGALVLRDGQTWWDDRQLAALQQMGVGDAPAGDQAVFLHVCQRTGLDPFAKQVHMIGRWDGKAKRTRWTIQTGIDGLRVIAQRTGLYRGRVGPVWCGPDGLWTDVWLNLEPPVAAKVGVLREGWTGPLFQVAMWAEYAQMRDGQPVAMWRDKPAHMLGKVAESLALRAAFPQDMAGLVGDDEMPNSNTQQPPPDSTQPVAVPARAPGVRMAGRAEWDALGVAFTRLQEVDGTTRSAEGKRDVIAQVLGLDGLGSLKDLTAEQATAAAQLIGDLLADGGEPVDGELVDDEPDPEPDSYALQIDTETEQGRL